MAKEHTAFEKHTVYMRGWRDGAGVRPIRTDHSTHPTLGGEYNRGYEEGRKAYLAAGAAEATRLNYKPSILRIQK